MADFNQVLDVGDWQNGLVNTVVDIPMGSTLKMEWDRERACFVLGPRRAGNLSQTRQLRFHPADHRRRRRRAGHACVLQSTNSDWYIRASASYRYF